MVSCPICKAENDDGNRFCDQCGARLTSIAPPAPPAAAGPLPSWAAPAAPSVQDVTEPALPVVEVPAPVVEVPAPVVEVPAPAVEVSAPVVEVSAPVVEVSAPAVEVPAPAVEVPAPVVEVPAPVVVCSTCGQTAPTGQRFCESCGSRLPEASAASVVPEVAAAPIAPVAPVVPEVAAAPIAPVAPVVPEVAAAPVAPIAHGATMMVPVNVQLEDERQRLAGLVAAHRETVASYQQMINRYAAGQAPAFIVLGHEAALAEQRAAEDALAGIDQAIAALPVGPDPAEVARLEGQIAAHTATIEQLDQMMARYPATGVPAFLRQSREQALAELDTFKADLAQLVGGTAPVAAPVAAASAVPSPRPLRARLVLESGQVIELPDGLHVYAIGRIDPVSNIFPEVDMTSYGGEAGGVSRQHARLTQQDGGWQITDLNSTNRTRVDGVVIEPQTPVRLSNGSRLQFGRLAATFVLE